jgi:hypothetical protein
MACVPIGWARRSNGISKMVVIAMINFFYLPLKSGVRFSLKARTPSILSSVPTSRL